MQLGYSKIPFSSFKLKYFFVVMALFPVILLLFDQKAFAQSENEAPPASFLDVTNTSPYYVAVSYLKTIGVITGYEDKTFMPDAKINRVESLRLILDGAKIVSDEAFEAYYADVKEEQWFAGYVVKAHHLGIVKGEVAGGNFRPDDQVNLVEFLKMLLMANEMEVSSVHDKPGVPTIPPDAWFADYLNYAVQLGIVSVKPDGTLDPAHLLTRGEVANMMYLLSVMKQGGDTNFLLTQAQAQMAQIEIYISANRVPLAKEASQLGVQFTQQAYKKNPTDALILGQAKVARAYDWWVESVILGIQKKNEEAAQKANDAIDKATEAWQADKGTQPIAAHIKEKARELLVQVGGVEK